MNSKASCVLFLFGLCLLLPADLSANGEGLALQLGPRLEGGLSISGPDARVQLFVTARDAAGKSHDATREVTYRCEPAGIVHVDAGGVATPLEDGTATIVASYQGETDSLPVTVVDFHRARPLNFTNQIVPIFTKLGCNGGGCHGKASGQNGFKLSLLGFHPEDDYEFLVKESRARRIFPAAPERSLILTKPLGEMPHGGGKRLEKNSYEYRMLRRWIEQGMPFGSPTDPVVARIECLPAESVMDQGRQQQLAVHAIYTDGTREDVTRMAIFEPNDVELAESSETGLVSTLDLSGEVAVMARYQGQVATFRATIPLGVAVTETPPSRNFIDDEVFRKLRSLGIPPSPLCDDATFMRRVSIDITGTLPTEPEVREFLADSSPEKRDRLIEELLNRPEYADYFANKWNMILRNKKRQDGDQAGTFNFHQWIWDSLYRNQPYDEFVRDIVTASGDPGLNPPVTWYREVASLDQQVEDTAQLFLGVRIQCARCHHHPYERWSQDDYYGLAAFFSRIGKKELGAEVARNSRDRRIYHNDGVAQSPNPRSGVMRPPSPLGQPAVQIPSDRDPRFYLADWMADPENPFFARALVNRYWKHFFSRGLVEPEDDMRATNPPTNPELLDRLAESFIASDFDLKQLIRTICQSSTYQLSSTPNEFNLKDKQNFSRYYPQRLTAEALYDAFHQVTLSSQTFQGMPPGTRAVELPDVSTAPYFLRVFGQPQGDSACECERSQAANLAQSLHLLNSQDVQNKIASAGGRAHLLAGQSDRPHEERVRELYRWVYARDPQPEEVQIALAHIERHADKITMAYEDILWALINTKEFLFNH
ncbi:DUF1549 and DUF1553 domain-containing protein [Planctomicrobium sp. SH664]|uniref:DUF1549 and DUF1553 domain-containing protein n=1 Tax=Planctomicrobium sp. SH664 TaxID=3448125 RepID=UPI003F5C8FB4